MGEKTVGELIEEDASVEIEGTNVKVKGSIKNVTEEWAEFDGAGEKTGHFFPLLLPDECANKDVTIKGGAADDTRHVGENKLLVIRLEDLTGSVATIYMAGKLIATIDFSEAKLRPYAGKDAIAIAQQTETMGDAGLASQLIADDVSIAWTGTTGVVTGTVHQYTMPEKGTFKGAQGHFLPIVITGHDGEAVKITGCLGFAVKKDTTKWILQVDNFVPQDANIKLVAGETTLCELDAHGVTCE